MGRSGRSFASSSKSTSPGSKRSRSKKGASAPASHIEFTTGRSTEDLQQAVGNASVGRMLQRRGDHASSAKDRKAAAAAKADAKGEAELLAMTIDFVLKSPAVGPDDIAGLSAAHQSFMVRLYQVVHNRPFDKTREGEFTAASREADLNLVESSLGNVANDLQKTPSGKVLNERLQASIRNATSDIVRNAVWVHSREDGMLAAQLVSRPAQEARESALAVLRQTYDMANKLLVAPADAAKGDLLGPTAKEVNDGVGLLVKVLKSVDPKEYRKSIDEAREYCQKHGVALGITKGVQVVAELTELTAGTAVSIGSSVSKYVVKAFGAGADLKALEALKESGELLSSGNKVALKFAQIGEFLEKADKVLSAVAVIGGYAKLATAESTFDRLDGIVEVGSGVLGLAGKFAGEELVFGVAGGTLAAAATAVTLPWMAVKFVKYLGELGGGAVEGSLYGGLYEELRDIQPYGDEVSRDMLVLATAIDDRDRRAGAGAQGERAAGADEAVEDAVHKLRKSLQAAVNRMLRSQIDALGRTIPESVITSMQIAAQPGYPPEAMVSSAGEFLGILTGCYDNAADVVLDMAVDQGYIDRADVDERRAAMHKAMGK